MHNGSVGGVGGGVVSNLCMVSALFLGANLIFRGPQKKSCWAWHYLCIRLNLVVAVQSTTSTRCS